MLFNEMWDSEIERIAVQKCSPFAMRLHGYADLCSLLCLPLLILWYMKIITNGWWILLLWALGRVVYVGCGTILAQHEFDYDSDNMSATWRDKAGVQHTYTYQNYKNETND